MSKVARVFSQRTKIKIYRALVRPIMGNNVTYWD